MASRRLIVEIVGDASSLERSFLRSSAASSAFSREVGRAGRGVTSISLGYRGLARSVAFASGAFLGAAGLTAAIKASVTGFAQFNTAMQQSVGLADVAQKNIGSLSNQVLALAPRVGKSPQELAKAFYFVASSGIAASKAMSVVTAAAKASAAGLGETQVVADAVTSAMNAYGPSVLSAQKATDVLVATVRQGKGEATDFAGVIGNVTAIAAQLGVSFNEVGAALAAETRLGIDAGTAATQLQRIFSSLLKVTPASAAAFKSVGLNADELRQQLGTKGLLAVLEEVRRAFGDNTPAITKAFGDVRAFRGVLALVGKQAGATEQIFREMSNTTGSLGTAFGAVSNTMQQKFNQLKAAAQVLAIAVGGTLAKSFGPAVRGAATYLSNTKNQERIQRSLTAAVRDFSSVVKEGARAANTIAQALGGWKNAITLVIGAWVGFKAAGIGAAIAVQTANVLAAGITANAWRAALISTGWGALAIAAGAAAAYVITHWQKVKAFFVGFGRFLVNVFKSAWNIIEGIFFIQVANLLIPVEALARGLNAALGWIPGLGGKIGGALQKVSAFIDGFRRRGIAQLRAAGTDMGNAWGSAFQSSAKGAFSGLASSIAADVNSLGKAIADATGKKFKPVGQTSPTPSASTATATPKAAQDVVTKGFVLPFRLQLAQARASATKTVKDDLQVAKEVRAFILKAIPHLHGQKLIDAYTQLGQITDQIAQDVKAAGKKAQDFVVPATLQLAEARAQALGLSDTAILRKMKAAAEKALRSGKLSIQGQIDAWNEVSSINDQLQSNAKTALGQFKQLNTRKLTADLNLTPEQRAALRARLSQIGPGGTVPGQGVGAFGFAIDSSTDRPIVVKMDGKKVGESVTRHQQKKRRRNSSQRRGPNAGLAFGF